jgi:hypothetical protein
LDLDFERAGDSVTLDLRLDSFLAARLRIAVGTVDVGARAHLSGARVRARSGDGSVEARVARLNDFRLLLGSVEIDASELEAQALKVGWGRAGFELDASDVVAPALGVVAGGARVGCRAVRARSISVRGDRVLVEGLETAGSTVELDLARPPTDSEAVAGTKAGQDGPPAVDWSLLDGLAGRVQVDATDDVTVPVIGHRRATHP